MGDQPTADTKPQISAKELADELRALIPSENGKLDPEACVKAFSNMATAFFMSQREAVEVFLRPQSLGIPDNWIDTLPQVVLLQHSQLRFATLQLLHAACMLPDCRKRIESLGGDWLWKMMDGETEDRIWVSAAVLFAKIIRDGGRTGSGTFNVQNSMMVLQLVTFLDPETDDAILEQVVEGLALESTRYAVRVNMNNSSSLPKTICDVLLRAIGSNTRKRSDPKAAKQDEAKQDETKAPDIETPKGTTTPKPLTVFSTFTIVANLTNYSPKLTAEEKRLLELAKASLPQNVDRTDGTEPTATVTERCGKFIDAGITQALVATATSPWASVNLHGVLARISVSLTEDRQHRGKLIQDGVLRMLLWLLGTFERVEDKVPSDQRAAFAKARQDYTITLARLLIVVDPRLVFVHNQNPGSAVNPLSKLLAKEVETMAQFDSLRALTNLAEIEEYDPHAGTARALITQHCLDKLYELVLSRIPNIRQASTECLCNLTVWDGAVNAILEIQHLLTVLNALTWDDYVGTRRAATAALYNVVETEEGMSAFFKLGGSTNKSLDDLIWREKNDEDEDVRIRAAAALKSLTRTTEPAQRAVLERSGYIAG